MCLGIPARIVEVTDPAGMTAVVEVGGVRREANISFIVAEGREAGSYVGDWVLLHVGFAMSRLDATEAARTLALLEELAELQPEMAMIGLSERS
jgi:hydrogenase expression/formation protein HypC